MSYIFTVRLIHEISSCLIRQVPLLTLLPFLIFSKSHKVHELFQSVQKNRSLKVLSIKRLNRVRWNSKEFCLQVFLSRFDCIIDGLQTVADDESFAENQRATANGLHSAFQTKQSVATAYLFQEIFAVIGPLSRYLQNVDVDFGKAIDMVDSSISRSQEMRESPEKLIEIADSSVANIEWSQHESAVDD